MFYLSEAQPDT